MYIVIFIYVYIYIYVYVNLHRYNYKYVDIINTISSPESSLRIAHMLARLTCEL